MNVSFEVSSFKGRPKSLISILHHMRMAGIWPRDYNREVEEVVCKTPSSALNYCRHVVGAFGISRESEKVFLKNPGIGIRYLRIATRSYFLDESVQKRFWKKVTRNPKLAYDWAITFMKRLPEEDEVVFVKDILLARSYSRDIIRGAFPEMVHRRLMLRSFEPLSPRDKANLTDYLKYAESRLQDTSEKPVQPGV